MNINRYNYDEFFLLYVDNELTKAERQEVEAFVHANADLEEELIMLKQSKLRPEAAITFEGKEALMKPENADFINDTNYEEFFLLYVDNELNAVERREIESFAATKPPFQQELNLLLQTKLEPEHAVVFPDKSLLYKQEEKKRPVVIIGWQRIVAVAAILLVALGIFWLSGTGTGTGTQKEIAKKETNQQQQSNTSNENASDANNATDATAANTQQQPNNNTAEVIETANQPQVAAQNKTSRQANTTNRKYDAPVNSDNQLAHQKTVDVITDASEQTGKTLASVDVTGVEKNAGSNISTALETASVNSGVRAAGQPVVQIIYEDQDPNVYIANTTVDRKNKLRGLFRKVTRVFEKTTNLPAVEERGLLIGSFEIALK